jgi:hypothetical protein
MPFKLLIVGNSLYHSATMIPLFSMVAAGYADTTFPHPTRSLDDYMSQVDTAQNEEVKNQLYKEAKAKEAQ